MPTPNATPASNSKRANGRYFTRGNPFQLKPFRAWAQEIGLRDKRILEPFAGANHLIDMLSAMDLCRDFAAYDIAPAAPLVRRRDTVARFPRNFEVCVTNPPWLARNSASRRGLPYPQTRYDDLYKHCLDLCLAHCPHVAAIVPATVLHSGLFRDRLQAYILLHDTMFTDTENPVCLALFGPRADDAKIYYDEKLIGTLSKLEEHRPPPASDRRVRFNDPQGELGFISFDNTRKPSIRFCHAAEIEDYEIKVSSRFITRISGVRLTRSMIKRLNTRIREFRKQTQDVFLTPFKGIRDDGQYRRRMDFALARDMVAAA